MKNVQPNGKNGLQNGMETVGASKVVDISFSRTDRIATWKANRRQLAYSTVGTPDYIAPEVFATKGEWIFHQNTMIFKQN